MVVAGAIALTGCQLPSFGAYKGATTQARSTFHLWQGFFIAGLIVGGFVLLLILWAIFRYRRNSDDIPRQSQYHTLTEVLYTVVPILIVIGLFIATVVVENKVDAVSPNPDATIHVYAFQWGWEFKYPNGVQVIGQTTDAPTMVVPTGQSVHIYLRSYDVLHGFYVPEFNFSRYASPGYWTDFQFNVLHNGVYRGQCTQLLTHFVFRGITELNEIEPMVKVQKVINTLKYEDINEFIARIFKPQIASIVVAGPKDLIKQIHPVAPEPIETNDKLPD